MKRVAILFLLATGMNMARADDGSTAVAGNINKWKAECGACHVAYPPELLAGNNWQRLMDNLDKHFGVNAALNAKDKNAILGFLLRNAGSGERYSATTLRISDTPWFRREHRSLAAEEWKHAGVKSPSNCSACHGKTVLGG